MVFLFLRIISMRVTHRCGCGVRRPSSAAPTETAGRRQAVALSCPRTEAPSPASYTHKHTHTVHIYRYIELNLLEKNTQMVHCRVLFKYIHMHALALLTNTAHCLESWETQDHAVRNTSFIYSMFSNTNLSMSHFCQWHNLSLFWWAFLGWQAQWSWYNIRHCWTEIPVLSLW